MHFVRLLRRLKIILGLYHTPRGMHWQFSIILCLNKENVTDGLRYNHVSASLEDPRGGQSEIDWDLKGQSRGYDMASLQTVPCHIAGMLVLSCWKREMFPTG